MERLDNQTLTFFETVALVIFILIQSACAQKGFTSLECCGESIYTETNTDISWQSDDSWFPNRSNCRSGTIINAAKNNTANYSLRVFESEIAKKWCYNLTTTPKQTYLIRGTFSFADQETPASSFNVSIGVTPISQVKSTENYAEVEGIFKATRNYVDYCLVEGNGDASISKLELRSTVDMKYTNKEPNSVLKLIARVDLGNKGVPIRYPDDASDRIWKAPSIPTPNYTLLSASSSLNASAYPVAPPVPLPVLQTALQHYDRLDFNHLNLDAGPQNYSVYLYFLELNSTVGIGQRVFDVYINSHKLLDGVDIFANGPSHNQYVLNVSASGSLSLSLLKVVNGSRFGPILNAYEIMQVVSAVQESNQDTVDVIVEVKNELLVGNPSSQLLEGWTGDPCLPVEWRGVTCQHFNGSDVITELDLSLQKLNGFLPASVTQLTYLTRLNLSNNGFTGSIPEFPVNSRLTSVDLSYNNLTGRISPPLSSLPYLTSLYFGCNLHLSKELPVGFNINRTFTSDYGKCGQSSPGVREIIIGTVICGSILLGVTILMIFLYCRRLKLSAPLGFEGQAYTTKSAVFALTSMDEFIITTVSVKSFTLDYIENVTQKYQTLIGEGGFGSVYRGTLSDGEEVAVKVRSTTSTQGTREFENELNLLSDIRHENLVPLLGYCWENEQQILVYPYMSNGSLQDRLYGEAAKRKTLDWPTRLSIALGAARGLAYLHTYAGGCVIHRDVKSSNILLDHSMCAKVADFGFSKYAPEEGDSVVSLEVRGTAGYLDPEYYSTQHLSAKSDVFSFGVVLLEIVTGREPLNIQRPRSEWSLVEWAKSYIGNQKIEEIVDPNIKGGYHSEAMWRVVEAALACIEAYGAYRPSMADIVRELEDALIIENNASEYMRSIDSLGGSARYALPTENRILQLPTKPSIETSTASQQSVSIPQPR